LNYRIESGWFDDGYYAFWDVQERTASIERIIPAEEQIAGGIRAPERWEFWWWFRASRVINDRDLPTRNCRKFKRGIGGSKRD
jgi:hypothetical protein